MTFTFLYLKQEVKESFSETPLNFSPLQFTYYLIVLALGQKNEFEKWPPISLVQFIFVYVILLHCYILHHSNSILTKCIKGFQTDYDKK